MSQSYLQNDVIQCLIGVRRKLMTYWKVKEGLASLARLAVAPDPDPPLVRKLSNLSRATPVNATVFHSDEPNKNEHTAADLFRRGAQICFGNEVLSHPWHTARFKKNQLLRRHCCAWLQIKRCRATRRLLLTWLLRHIHHPGRNALQKLESKTSFECCACSTRSSTKVRSRPPHDVSQKILTSRTQW